MYSNTFKLLDDASFSNKIATTCILQLHLQRVVVTLFYGKHFISSFSHAQNTLIGKTSSGKSNKMLNKWRKFSLIKFLEKWNLYETISTILLSDENFSQGTFSQ